MVLLMFVWASIKVSADLQALVRPPSLRCIGRLASAWPISFVLSLVCMATKPSHLQLVAAWVTIQPLTQLCRCRLRRSVGGLVCGVLQIIMSVALLCIAREEPSAPTDGFIPLYENRLVALPLLSVVTAVFRTHRVIEVASRGIVVAWPLAFCVTSAAHTGTATLEGVLRLVGISLCVGVVGGVVELLHPVVDDGWNKYYKCWRVFLVLMLQVDAVVRGVPTDVGVEIVLVIIVVMILLEDESYRQPLEGEGGEAGPADGAAHGRTRTEETGRVGVLISVPSKPDVAIAG